MTESALKYVCRGEGVGRARVNTKVRQRCFLASSLFNTCMDCVLGTAVDQSHCGVRIGNTRVTHLIFVDDVVIHTKSLEVLVAQGIVREGKGLRT